MCTVRADSKLSLKRRALRQETLAQRRLQIVGDRLTARTVFKSTAGNAFAVKQADYQLATFPLLAMSR
jgi:hypothetical protein